MDESKDYREAEIEGSILSVLWLCGSTPPHTRTLYTEVFIRLPGLLSETLDGVIQRMVNSGGIDSYVKFDKTFFALNENSLRPAKQQCQWNTLKSQFVEVPWRDGDCRNVATQEVGPGPGGFNWLLCDSCAAGRYFDSYAWRRPVDWRYDAMKNNPAEIERKT